jgi:hypothetical protein
MIKNDIPQNRADLETYSIYNQRSLFWVNYEAVSPKKVEKWLAPGLYGGQME